MWTRVLSGMFVTGADALWKSGYCHAWQGSSVGNMMPPETRAFLSCACRTSDQYDGLKQGLSLEATQPYQSSPVLRPLPWPTNGDRQEKDDGNCLPLALIPFTRVRPRVRNRIWAACIAMVMALVATGFIFGTCCHPTLVSLWSSEGLG